ncbi:DUF2786 domain-containing protein [Listeria monocytogenes]|uniref:DUF2786 domain-containing protein n=1 Tax=Listeria monocytogenes TaxID=1639 RepID=UPI0011EDDCFF|nr:DUF2786 domain-containing protein [Listeria monocytogenes]TYU25367.1 DUF2786 domain-containing protein [Listeria monocytogenes]TYU32107.1 DUF2786 domain-containing protein [Listeria monocytogenes]
MDNEKIIRKVKRLLALARENKNDEEGQTAFMFAQRLMLENNIKESELSDDEAAMELITENNITIYKKLFWWERSLADVIADNFRVKSFYKVRGSSSAKKSAITFFGLEKDLELAKEMYLLAYEAVVFHSKAYVNDHYKQTNEKRERYFTEQLKTSYIRGFLDGMDAKFREQISILRNEFEVLVLMPQKVEDEFEKHSEDFGTYDLNIPAVESSHACAVGYEQGNSIDFTKSTISENVGG